MATATTTTFRIRGFHCSGCSDNLGRALEKLEGVIRARGDYEAATVEVRFDSDRVGEDDLRERIRASGFEPV